MSHCSAARGLWVTDHVILNHGQVTRTTPELAHPHLTSTLHQREDVSALDRFNVHRCPTRWVFSGIELELVTRRATIRNLDHSGTTAAQSYGRATATFSLTVHGINRDRNRNREALKNGQTISYAKI
ncbi:uncharacterized protein TNCV_3159561 [Trichonephila clavipes]|nr:uncharacterized protein TNCV_3159561 [Trichonephila clavipes]